MTQNQIAFANMQESQRSNLAREHEAHRSNTVREVETNRANLINEEIGKSNLNERVRQYDDMASYNKALSVASTAHKTADTIYTGFQMAESVSRQAANYAQAAKDTRKAVSVLGGL